MTIKEIANLAGVSISTVSKIVNGKDQNINPETRRHVLKIVKEYNYTPYGTIKTLSQTKTFLIGVLLRSASRTNLMLNGILHTAAEHGYHILLFDSMNCPDTELKNITALCRNKVDGVIWEPVSQNSYMHAHYFTESGAAVCYINAPDISMGYRIDFAQMGYMMTQKLIDYKHSSIACLLKEDSHRSQMVFEGFKKCLFDNQISYTDKMRLSISDNDCCSKILGRGFSGVLCSHYASALAIYEQINKLHYYIPSDLSLISLKDDVRENISFPRISSIKIPYQEFGGFVCQKLVALCESNGEKNPEDFSSEYSLDHGDSLDAPSFFRTKKIVVVGSINIDNTFNVDGLPQAGKTTTILSSSTTLGGKGANQSVGAARLGHEVSLIGEIGNDAESAFIFDILEKEKISTLGIHRNRKFQTGKAYIYIEKDGEGTITILSGANGCLSPENIRKRRHLFENAGYCLISTEIPLPTVIEAAHVAKSCGAGCILKPAALKSIPSQLLETVDILIPNRKEAAALCPQYTSPEKQAQFFFDMGIPTVIITLGHKGCYLKTSDIAQFFPAADFIAADTTGGADAFISALASYLIEGFPLEKAVPIANYAAGFCVSRQGVVPALIDYNTLENHIQQFEPKLLEG